MKRTICVVIALLLILAALPAYAAEGKTSGLFTYEVKKNGTAVITDFNWTDNDGEDVIVPPLIDGYSVVEIADFAFQCEDKWEAMKSDVLVTLPESLVSIGDFAFMYSEIKSINIPNSLQSMGIGVFHTKDRKELQFRIDPNQQYFAVIDNTLFFKPNKELVTMCLNSKQTIPEGIVSIRAYACDEGYKGVIFLPSTLTSVGDYAFYRARTKIKINSPLEKVGAHAFESGNDIYFIDNCALTEVSDYAFYNCDIDYSKAANRYFMADIVSLGDYSGLGDLYTNPLLFNPLITTIPSGLDPRVSELPETVTAIESEAFLSKKNNFKLSKSLTDIADDAFPTGSTFIVESGSYAQRWADENGFTYSIEGADNLDWLNN